MYGLKDILVCTYVRLYMISANLCAAASDIWKLDNRSMSELGYKYQNGEECMQAGQEDRERMPELLSKLEVINASAQLLPDHGWCMMHDG